MEEIFIPKSDTNFGTSPEIIKYLDKVVVPTSMDAESEKRFQQEILQRVIHKEAQLEKKIDDYKSEVDGYKKDLEKQSSRNIEIIGIFSAVLALLIIDVNIIKSFDSFLSAILLIVSLNCSMVIFISLIHTFFSSIDKKEDRVGLEKSFWIPNIILIVLVLAGILLWFFNIDINKVRGGKNQIINPESTQLPTQT